MLLREGVPRFAARGYLLLLVLLLVGVVGDLAALSQPSRTGCLLGPCSPSGLAEVRILLPVRLL